jgi:hypothetical protein
MQGEWWSDAELSISSPENEVFVTHRLAEAVRGGLPQGSGFRADLLQRQQKVRKMFATGSGDSSS